MAYTNATRRSLLALGRLMKRSINRRLPIALKAKILPPGEALISNRTWNHEYGSGFWDFLSTTQEFGRYSLISGYCRHLKPAARVLDVGCGSGVLAHWLSSAAISSYFGIDLSEVAIEQARRSNFQRAEFDVADASVFETSQVFDVIVFNEMLYYLKTPEEHVRRIARSLAPGGILIVSIYYHADGIRTWKRLKAGFKELDRVRIVHFPSRIRWDLLVLRPQEIY